MHTFVHTHNIVDDLTASCKQCIAHSIHLCTCFIMCYIFAVDSMLIMHSHGVSTAVKRDAADDI